MGLGLGLGLGLGVGLGVRVRGRVRVRVRVRGGVNLQRGERCGEAREDAIVSEGAHLVRVRAR